MNSNRELYLAGSAMILISALYFSVIKQLNGVPAASDFFGHSLGVVGFLLMLLTESLYSLRKRSRSARWGRMAHWLQFHIFTGLVGPFMVLLHSSWKFNGLAGVVMLLTVIIVASGFVGRYIYTAVPRSADGIALEADDIEAEVGNLNQQLVHFPPGKTPSWLASLRLPPEQRKQLAQRQRLLLRQKTLRRQLQSLAVARRMLAVWHMVHVPIGLALFTFAFIHAGAAFYYATLLR